MQIKDIIKKRRSVFPAQYNNRPISKDDIMDLLAAANCAPTHRKTEPWRFKIFHGDSQEDLGRFLAEKYKETTDKFKEFKYNKLRENPKKAAAVLAICMQRDPEESLPEWEEIAATAMAVQNMWLLATAKGIGSYWSSPGLIKYMGEFIKLNEGERCLGYFYLGYYDEFSPERIPGAIEDKISWI
ncbi:MAG: nitroreductase [Flavobacteriaceae bacterium]|nr:nitroreductase [Flavobacteriaceae bacterium]